MVLLLDGWINANGRAVFIVLLILLLLIILIASGLWKVRIRLGLRLRAEGLWRWASRDAHSVEIPESILSPFNGSGH